LGRSAGRFLPSDCLARRIVCVRLPYAAKIQIMPPRFDSLHKWLGIPAAEQPPHAYRLLGIAPFEDDADVIANAADQRMLFIKTLASGPNVSVGEGLLNQIAAARLCLLNPTKKAAYDTALRNYLAGPQSASSQRTPPPAPDAGALFGQFTLFERIGGDTLGPIFKAKSRKDGTLVSLKILPPEVAKNERLLKRFEREVSLVAKLRHPNVVGGVGVGAQDGIHFLVLEYVDGVDLAEILHRVGPPEIHKTVGYMVQAAGGLQYLHENKVYHRNVKPGNLLVDRSGVVKITNLLMAHIAEASYLDGNDDALTRTGEMLGTVDYVAPEQAGDASTADERADIYSLGCTMFHLFAGRLPYTGKNMMDKLVAHREAPIPSLAALRPDVSKGLERVVTRMLAKKRTERQQSMNEVIAALKPHATPGSRQGFWSRLVPHR
jgi:serine/threonine protein kinase